MKNEITKHNNTITNPVIDRLVMDRFSEGLAQASLAGKTDAISGKPSLENSSISVHTESIWTHFNSTLAMVNNQLQAPLNVRLGSAERIHSSQKASALQKQYMNEEADLSLKIKKVTDWPVIGFLVSFLIAILVVLGLGYAECKYLVQSLQVIVGSLASAIMLGIGITLGIGIIGHFAESWIVKNITNLRVRRIARICLVALFAVTFIVLGFIRKEYIWKMQGVETSVWVFVGINFILCIALYLISEMWLNPLLNDLREVLQVIKTRRAISIQKRKIEALKQQIADGRESLEESLNEKMMLVAYHTGLESMIECQYLECISAYKKENLSYRDDGIPDCFTQEPKSLTFFTKDIPFNNTNV